MPIAAPPAIEARGIALPAARALDYIPPARDIIVSGGEEHASDIIIVDSNHEEHLSETNVVDRSLSP